MDVKEFEVSYLEKVPSGRFQSQAFGLALRVRLGSVDEQKMTEELAQAFSKAQEMVKLQIAFADRNQ
jgi:DhnA family fructose-bisphosphate aldolase class Ia